MIIRSKSPLRISFGGGGTDVSPYPEEWGGAVLSTTIDRYAYATLDTGYTEGIDIKSLDFDTVVNCKNNNELNYDGKLDLVKAAIKAMNINESMRLFLHTDAPPGSGLGSSSALTVALVGVFTHWRRLAPSQYDIAEMAYHIEREELRLSGGKQDQYTATFGGFNFIEFFGNSTVVNPLRLKPDLLNELQYRLMLCFTGETRPSIGIIDDQISRYRQGNKETVQALHLSKDLAFSMKNALLLGKLDEFGSLLHEAWCLKQKFSSKMTDAQIDELYEVARKNGAIGGKLLGAGGGGYLLFFCQFDRWHTVAERLKSAGGTVTNFAFDPNGLQTWEVNNGDSNEYSINHLS
jgi:D-glycero-alpha-D-manno-heptose-7-phosphate kinase